MSGAGIQTLVLEGPVSTGVTLEQRTYIASQDALLQLTPGGARKGAGASQVLPVGAFDGYTYRSAIEFPEVDWTGVKRLVSATLVLTRSDQQMVQFGSEPTYVIRRITRPWSSGVIVSPSPNASYVYPGGPTAPTTQIRDHPRPLENRVRRVNVTNIVLAWVPVTSGGRGIAKDYGFMLMPGSGRERDTIEFWSLEHGGASRPVLELQVEVTT